MKINETNDPAKVAQVVLRLASSDRLPAHLLVGKDAVQGASGAEAARTVEAKRWEKVSISTDINACEAVPALQS